MMLIRSMFICGLLCVLWGRAVGADESVPAAADAQKYPGADRGNFLLIRDPLPLIKRMLQSKGVRTVVRAIPDLPPLDDLEQLLEEDAQEWIPVQITVAAGSDELTPIAAMLKAAQLSEFCRAAVGAGLAKQLDDIQAELLATLKDIRAPEMDVWVQFREEDAAIRLETQLRAFLSELLQEDAIETEIDAEHVRVSMSVSDFTPASLLQGVLFTENLSDDLSDPNLAKMAELISPLSIQFLLRREGATLHLSIGSKDSQPSEITESSVDRLLWRDSSDDLMYCDIRAASITKMVVSVDELWKQLQGTELGNAIESSASPESDPEEIAYLGQLLGKETGHVEIRVSFPEGGSECIVDTVESTSATVKTLRESEVLQFLPAEANAWISDSDRSPVDLIREIMAQLEQYLEPDDPISVEEPVLRILAQIRGAEQEPRQDVKAAYLEQYGELRKLLRTDSQAAFRSHFLLTIGETMIESSVEAAFQYHEQDNAIRIETLSIPQFCMVMAITDISELNKLAGQLSAQIQILKPTASSPVYLRETSVDRIDQKVWCFTDELFGSLLPYGLKLRVSEECTPHFVVLEDRWLLFSNSLPLTRQILAAKKDESRRKVIPDDSEDYDFRTYFPQVAIQKSLLAPVQWMEQLAHNNLKISGTGYFSEGLIDGLKENDDVRSLLPEKLARIKRAALFIKEIDAHRTTRDGVHRNSIVIRFVH